MPRKSSVWFRDEDGCYYSTIRRKQIRLSPDEAEAERAVPRRLGQGDARLG